MLESRLVTRIVWCGSNDVLTCARGLGRVSTEANKGNTDMTLEAITINQMTAAEKAFFMESIEAGNLEAAQTILKEAMTKAVEKETKMANALLKNPRMMEAFNGIVYDMAAA
jgi:pantoate kinase